MSNIQFPVYIPTTNDALQKSIDLITNLLKNGYKIIDSQPIMSNGSTTGILYIIEGNKSLLE